MKKIVENITLHKKKLSAAIFTRLRKLIYAQRSLIAKKSVNVRSRQKFTKERFEALLRSGNANAVSQAWISYNKLICSSTNRIAEDVQILWHMGQYYNDLSHLDKYVALMLNKVAYVDDAKTLSALINSCYAMDSGYLRRHEQNIINLSIPFDTVGMKVMLSLLASSDDDISYKAYGWLKKYSSREPRALPVLGPLSRYAEKIGDPVDVELYKAREVQLAPRPTNKFELLRILSSKEKYQQARVVESNLTIPVDLPAGWVGLFELLMEDSEVTKTRQNELIVKVEELCQSLNHELPQLSDKELTHLFKGLYLFNRALSARFRISRVRLQSSVKNNPGAEGDRPTIMLEAQYAPLGSLLQNYYLELGKRKLKTWNITNSSSSIGIFKECLKILNEINGTELEKMVHKLECLYGEASWLAPYKTLVHKDDRYDYLSVKCWDTLIDANPSIRVNSITDECTSGTYKINANADVVNDCNFKGNIIKLEYCDVSLSLVDQDLILVGGSVLRPPEFHVSQFPRKSPSVVHHNESTVILDRKTNSKCVHDPVVVLQHNDANYTSNYYHQVVLIVGRVVLLKENGLLMNRKLVMPAATPKSTTEILELCGVEESSIIYADEDTQYTFTDARLVRTVEHIGIDAQRAFRTLVWNTLGIKENSKPTRKVYLKRRGQNGRALLNCDDLINSCRAHGYFEVYPEDLTIREQIELFADAKAIIGVSGASFTNTIFARDGIPVVQVSKRDVYSPTFIELGINHSHRCRWLLGENSKASFFPGYIASPFYLIKEEIDDALRWLENEMM